MLNTYKNFNSLILTNNVEKSISILKARQVTDTFTGNMELKKGLTFLIRVTISHTSNNKLPTVLIDLH